MNADLPRNAGDKKGCYAASGFAPALVFDTASRLSEWLRSRAVRRLERRQTPRRMIANLDAHYFDGTEAAGHVVRDVSTSGAFIFTTFKWPPGTIVTLTLQLGASVSAPGSPAPLLLRTKVVRCVPDGVGIQLLYLRTFDSEVHLPTIFSNVAREQ